MMRISGTSSKATMARLVDAARIEVLPTRAVEVQIVAEVPKTRTITVTSSPSKGPDGNGSDGA